MMNLQDGFQSDQTVAKLRKWATERDSIRAMLLTRTRANPHAILDSLSDYDIVLVVDDILPYYEDRNWLDNFGEVWVTYWDPIYKSPQTGIEIFGNVVQYSQKRAMTLLKNDEHTLPLKGRPRIFVKNVDPSTAARYVEVVATPEDADFAVLRLAMPWVPVETKNPFARSFHHGDLDFKEEAKAEIMSLLQAMPTIVACI